MKMPLRQTETHCQRHAGGGSQERGDKGERERAMGGQSQSQKPNLITRSMQKLRVQIEFHDLKSAMGQIENAKRLTLPAISLSPLSPIYRAQMGPVQGLVRNNAAQNSQIF